jgi:BirA family biotin operon repressor/biotin-[acetyl-CoA-carboxylase] ligase
MDYEIINMRASDGSVIRLEHHAELESTANLAREYAAKDYPDRYVVFTEKRIRRDVEGKIKETDEGIFMSLILRPSMFPSQATLLSPLCAVALVQGLEEHTESSLGIGWVGNVYSDGRLIGKTHVEGKLDSFKSYEYLIISFSCVLDKKSFPHRISDLIKKVFSEEKTSVPLIITADILNKFFLHYKSLKSPSKFMDAYRQRFILRGVRVSYTDQNGKKRRYKVMGVDPKNCALMLEGRDKKVFLASLPKSVEAPKRVKIK